VEAILKEQQPKRRREIASQLQELLTELQAIEGKENPPTQDERAPQGGDPSRYLKCGELTLDRHTHSAQYRENTVSLPPSSFDYLVTLVRHSPQAVAYEKLVQESQGYQHLTRAEAREISRWQMHEIRKLLEIDPRHPQLIITVRDVGYRLVA
jgi:DNA-binding response OmpR family regulator